MPVEVDARGVLVDDPLVTVDGDVQFAAVAESTDTVTAAAGSTDTVSDTVSEV